MHSTLHLENIRRTHPGDAAPPHWRSGPPPEPPPRGRLRRAAARSLAALAARLDAESAALTANDRADIEIILRP
jgi:hypothetical protein